MSAGDRWHEHGPVKDGDPIISSAILLLMQGKGKTEQSVLTWEADHEAAFGPESTPDVSAGSEDTLANLLRAIENTEIAASFPSLVLPESGHPRARISAQKEEVAEAVSALFQEPAPRADAAACPEAAPDAGAKSDESLTNLLRALKDAEIAATLEGIPRADYAEPAYSACAHPAESAEAAFTASEDPESDADAHLESKPQGALESESAAMPMDGFASAEAAAGLDDASTQFGEESSEVASSGQKESAEAASIPEPPLFRERRKTFRQQDRNPKRVVRRRNSDRGRSDYLLAIAASTLATPPSAAADAQAAEPLAAILNPAIEEPPPVAVEPKPARAAALAEPAEMLAFAPAPVIPALPSSIELEPTKTVEPLEPAKPVPAVAAAVAAEPEGLSTAEPAFTSDTPILPAAREADTPRPLIRAKLGAGIGSLSVTGDLINGGLDRAEMHLENWFQKWLGPPDPRRNVRVDKPPLVAYHWIVDVPQALKVANISAGGLHLVTRDRWSEGNIVSMTLQRTDREKGSPDSWIAVDFLVMRWCEDGMAGVFMPSVRGLSYTVAGRAANCADKKTLTRFIDRLIDAAADRLASCK